MSESFQSFLKKKNDFNHVVICGMAKTGTSLIASLLDGHKSLTVFPEELRFMDASCHRMSALDSADKLLANPNLQHLKAKQVNYDNVVQSGGTGYGLRDYSDLNYALFTKLLKSAFSEAKSPEERYLAVFYAYYQAKSINEDAVNSILVSKAPHNEIFIHSWQKMLNNKAKYIWMVRDPFEHFYSMNNIARAVNGPAVDVEDFCHLTNSRFDLMKMQEASTIFIKYEDLINQPETEISQVAQFLGIEMSSTLLNPTKNGHEWLGNSSRGVRDNTIYKNPAIAKKSLESEFVSMIAERTKEFRHAFGY